jgi:hypothetical protein
LFGVILVLLIANTKVAGAQLVWTSVGLRMIYYVGAIFTVLGLYGLIHRTP